MANYNYGGYPVDPAEGYFSTAGKVFMGGFSYTLVASSTEEKAFLLRNAAASGVQVKLVGFKASVNDLPAAATATGVLIRFYTVEAITGGSGTSATGKNLLLGGAASVATYHTSATTTATATTLLPISGQTSVISGSVSFEELAKNPIVIPEGYMVMVSVKGPAGIVPTVDLAATWIEDEA